MRDEIIASLCGAATAGPLAQGGNGGVTPSSVLTLQGIVQTFRPPFFEIVMSYTSSNVRIGKDGLVRAIVHITPNGRVDFIMPTLVKYLRRISEQKKEKAPFGW